MILQKEISNISIRERVQKSIIDKDWALGHFLDALYSIPELRQKLIFKGGTCIKKCYISDYRFSEDIDFTSNDKEFNLTRKHLFKIVELLRERVGMQTHIESLKVLAYDNQIVGYEAFIKFWGADHPRNVAPPPPQRWQTKVKIEIILYETVLFPITHRDINHDYSDALTNNAKQIPCYSLEEVLSEKMRSLVQRSYTAPRDLYDLWYLSNYFRDINYEKVTEAFHKKMAFKGHKFTGVDQLLNPENDRQLKAAWKNSLGHQITGILPDYNFVKDSLLELFNRILK